jgi:hypothetical protein
MKKSVFFFLLFVTQGLFTQVIDGHWQAYFGNYKLKNNFNWHNEAQTRFFKEEEAKSQFLIRNGIGYNFNPQNNLTLGYAFISSWESHTKPEHRAYQQFMTKQRFGKTLLLHRYRLEQRFLEDDLTWRWRYFLAAYYAINNDEVIAKTFYLSAYNEIFLVHEQRAFDQNRLYGGLGYAFTDDIKLEAAALYQSFHDRQSLFFQVVLFKNFAFKKHR